MKKIWIWTLVTSATLTLIVFAQTLVPLLPIPVQYDRAAHEVIGWDLLGNKVGEMISTMPAEKDPFIFGLTYQDASELAFYTPGQPYTVALNRWNRPNVYDYWWDDQELLGKNGLGVLRDGGSRQRLLTVFERVDPPYALPIHRSTPWQKGTADQDETIRIFYIYPCFGFKGGLRWMPRNKSDIRAIGNSLP